MRLGQLPQVDALMKSASSEMLAQAFLLGCRLSKLAVVALLVDHVQPNSRAPVDGFTGLALAAPTDNAELLLLLVARGGDPNLVDCAGRSALHWAAGAGAGRNVRALLSKGVALNLQDRAGATALMLAAEKGHASVVHQLLHAGADTLTANKARQSALHLACRAAGLDSVVAKLLLFCPSPDTADEWAQTPLLAACAHGRRGAAELLLKTRRVDVNARSKRLARESALEVAARQDDAELVALLLSWGALPNPPAGAGAVAVSALAHATQRNNTAMLAALLAAGADAALAVPDGTDAVSLLHVAARHGSLDALRLLLDAGGVAVDADSWTGTPLAVACVYTDLMSNDNPTCYDWTRRLALVTELLGRGASPAAALPPAGCGIPALLHPFAAALAEDADAYADVLAEVFQHAEWGAQCRAAVVNRGVAAALAARHTDAKLRNAFVILCSMLGLPEDEQQQQWNDDDAYFRLVEAYFLNAVENFVSLENVARLMENVAGLPCGLLRRALCSARLSAVGIESSQAAGHVLRLQLCALCPLDAAARRLPNGMVPVEYALFMLNPEAAALLAEAGARLDFLRVYAAWGQRPELLLALDREGAPGSEGAGAVSPAVAEAGELLRRVLQLAKGPRSLRDLARTAIRAQLAQRPAAPLLLTEADWMALALPLPHWLKRQISIVFEPRWDELFRLVAGGGVTLNQ